MVSAEIVLFSIFAYAGVDKLLNNLSFTASLLRTGYLPESWVLPLSVIIPVIELFLVLAGLFTTYTKGVLIGMTILIITFTSHLIWIYLMNPEVPCSCGALISSMPIGAHITMNMALVLVCVYLIRARKRMHAA